MYVHENPKRMTKWAIKCPVFIVDGKVIIHKLGGKQFYGTEIEIRAGLRPVGSNEKNGPIMINFCGWFFHV